VVQDAPKKRKASEASFGEHFISVPLTNTPASSTAASNIAISADHGFSTSSEAAGPAFGVSVSGEALVGSGSIAGSGGAPARAENNSGRSLTPTRSAGSVAATSPGKDTGGLFGLAPSTTTQRMILAAMRRPRTASSPILD